MAEAKAENKGLKIELAKALEPSEESVHETENNRPNPSIVMSPVSNNSKEAIAENDTEKKSKEAD